MQELIYFTFTDLLYDRWRSLLTIISLAVVVVGFLLLASLSQAILSLTRPAPLNNILLIVEANTIDPMDSSLDDSILQSARQAAPNQILRIFPILFRHLTIDGHIMQIRAVPLEEMSASMSLALVQGRWPDGLRQVVVSEGGAQLASWKIGSIINIYGTSYKVTGIVRTSENAFGSVWMSYPEGQRLFGISRGFQVGYLVLAPSENPESVRQVLQADPRISDHSIVYLDSVYTNAYNQSNTNLLILSSLMVLVSLLGITFGIYNATSLSLSERSLEIRLLYVLGFTLNRLRGFLFARTLVLTLAAYGLGLAASQVLINQQRLHASVDLIFLGLRLTPLFTLFGLRLSLPLS